MDESILKRFLLFTRAEVLSCVGVAVVLSSHFHLHRPR